MSRFTEGVMAGEYMLRGMKERRKDRAQQEVARILGEAASYRPGGYDPAGMGMPEEGQTARQRGDGYDGSEFYDLKDQLFEAAGYLPDMKAYAEAMELWGKTQAGKIQDAGMAALAAYDRGDMEGATDLMAEASAYMMPGVTPKFRIDPRSGAFVAVTHNAKGEPTGGAAFTRNDIEDLISRQDWNAYADRSQEQKNQDRTYALNLDKWGAQAAEIEQRMLYATNAEERAALESRLKVANANLEQQQALFNLRKSEDERVRGLVDEANKFVTSSITYNDQDAAAARKGRPSGGGYSGTIHPVLAEYESGNNFGEVGPETKYGVARGRAQFIEPRFNQAKAAGVIPPGMTFEQFGTDTPEGRAAQIAAEEWHFNDIDANIKKHGLDEMVRLGLTDPAGTPITLNGLRFAAHIAGFDGMLAWVKGGDASHDVNGKGPAEYMRMGYEATMQDPSAWSGAAAVGGIPTSGEVDILGQPVEGKKEAETTSVNPYFMTEPDETGASYPRPGVMAGIESLEEDIFVNNPDASPKEAGLMALNAFGAESNKVNVTENPDDQETAFISNGVNRFIISADMAGQIINYQRDVMGEREATAPRQAGGGTFNPNPQQAPQQAPQQQGALPTPTEVAAQVPTPGRVPGAAPGAPGAGPAAPGAAAAAPAPVAGAIPDQGAPVPPLPVDDTAVRMQR